MKSTKVKEILDTITGTYQRETGVEIIHEHGLIETNVERLVGDTYQDKKYQVSDGVVQIFTIGQRDSYKLEWINCKHIIRIIVLQEY